MIFLVGTDDKRVTVADGNYIATQYFEFFETFGIHRAIPISILNKACHMHGEHPDKTFEIVTRYSYDLKDETRWREVYAETMARYDRDLLGGKK